LHSKNWGKLSDIAYVDSGKRPPTKEICRSVNNNIPIIGASSIMGYTNTYLFDEPIIVIGRVGTHGVIQPVQRKSYPSDNTLIIKSKYYSFCYNILSEIDYRVLNKGSTQPLITQTDIRNTEIKVPCEKDLVAFEKENDMSRIFSLQEENLKLTELKQLYLKKFFG
jgi:type I restriction enzyme S subunit